MLEIINYNTAPVLQLRNATYPFAVTNIANVATLRTTEPVYDGQVIQLLGNVIAGQGAGRYYADYSDTTTADDGIKVIVTSAGKRWKITEEDVSEYSAKSENATTSRKIKTMLSEMASVKNFGAKGDDITDDTAAFNDAMNASGAKRMYIPPGIYRVGELKFLSGRHFYGANGRMYRNIFQFGQTILRGISGAREVLDVSGAHSYYLTNIIFDGVDKTMDGVSARTADAYGGIITGCSGTNCDKAFGTEAGAGRSLHSHRFIHTYAGKSKIGFTDTVDGFFDSPIADSNDNHGMLFVAGKNSNQVVNHRTEWNLGNGITNEGSSRLILGAGLFDRNSKADLFLDTAINSIFSGTNFSRGGAANQDVAGERSHIVIKNTCENIAITGNTSQIGNDDGGTGTTTPRHIIEFINAGASTNLNISMNTFAESTTGVPILGSLPSNKLTILGNNGIDDTMIGRLINMANGRVFQYRKPPTMIASGATSNFYVTGKGINANTRAFKTLRVWARNTNGSETAACVFEGVLTRAAGSASLSFAAAQGVLGTAGRITVGGSGTFIDLAFSSFAADGSNFFINATNNSADQVQVEIELS